MRDRLPELPPLHDVRAAKMLRDLGGERLGVDFIVELEDTFSNIDYPRVRLTKKEGARASAGVRAPHAYRRGAPCGG